MNQIELLRHVADNLEAGRIASFGLLFNGADSVAETADAIHLRSSDFYTLAPRTHTVNGFVVPAPMDVEPKIGGSFAIISWTDYDMAEEIPWGGGNQLGRMLKIGLCFNTFSDAQQNALAMLGRDPALGVDGV